MSYGANNPNGLPLGLPSIVSLGLAPGVNPYPALDLDFINNQTLDSRITFTRASSATFFDSAGVLQTAASGAARFTYDPATLQPQGLLIEEQRTNSIRNNTMVGAVAGTPGTLPTNWTEGLIGLTRQIVGTGTENGITYVDIRISGTTTSQFGAFMFDATNQIAASSGQTWTESFYAKIVAGSTSGLGLLGIRIFYNDAGGGFINGTFPAITLTSSLTRFSGTGTAPASTSFIQPGIYFNGVNASGDAVDVTLRIGLPQLELGAFATSVIPTTTTALTRNADAATMTGTNFSSWFNASEGTLYAEWLTPSSDAVNNRGIAAIDDGTNDNRVAMFIPNSALGAPLSVASRVVSGGSATNPANSGSIALSSVAKSVLAYGVGTNQAALSVNGGSPTTASPAATPVSVSILRIGTIFGVNNLNGTIRSIRFYPQRLSNAQLVALTG
jgi:hypothetical protein